MTSLAGRHVAITGGQGALGRGVVETLEARGAIVHVTPSPPGFRLDDEAQATAWYAELPPLWASIHLVGGFAMAPLLEVTLADLDAQWRINAATCFLACREAVRSMRRTGGGGRIVNVTARPVLAPVGGMSAYVAAKAAVAALTQALAVELRPDGILVNAVVPSIIDSPANRAAMPDADHAAWPRPTELAQAIGFLISPENTLTSGALVPVYGRA
jgi:NAD(P)-dependent dehydrogenase (short-subunit alcohol dehydrogenase family)